ncbi:MAG: hypothetical protein MO846_01950 [Candidatus Devosia symbiotica]|nr:hypothetical protein [Candidatus Devosia symbiotica]
MTVTMAEFELSDTMKLHLPHNPVVGNAEFRAAMAAIALAVSVATAR